MVFDKWQSLGGLTKMHQSPDCIAIVRSVATSCFGAGVAISIADGVGLLAGTGGIADTVSAHPVSSSAVVAARVKSAVDRPGTAGPPIAG